MMVLFSWQTVIYLRGSDYLKSVETTITYFHF